MRDLFTSFANSLIHSLQAGEEISLFLSAEESFFLRINEAKVRQTIRVSQAEVTLTFIKDKRNIFITIPFETDQERNLLKGQEVITQCRQECEQVPPDPFCITLQNFGDSSEDYPGVFPQDEEWIDTVLPHLEGLDCAGLLTAGSVTRANMNSLGQNHWYKSHSFFIDFSLYTPDQQAVKFFYGDKNWSEITFLEKLQNAKSQLDRLNFPKKVITPGKYRTYFAPEAVADLLVGFSWNGIGAGCYHQGHSAFKLIADGKVNFSPIFNLTEDFSGGFSPRFNSLGELASASLPIIIDGELKNFLVSTKTAKEYHLTSNYAEQNEHLRSPSISPGTIRETEILKHLDTGLYVGNVHYLNWSDLNTGRLTGMTRYACFWVEKGEIVSPIHDLRFDDTIYHLFGQGLRGLTESAHPVLETSTYHQRAIGGKRVPGILVDQLTYTL